MYIYDIWLDCESKWQSMVELLCGGQVHQHSNMFHVSVLQHAQMLVVRKEGKAHNRYNSFRSAFELLEAVGREPKDCLQEKANDLPPLQTLEKKVMMQNTEIAELKQQIKCMQQQMQQQMQSMQQEIQEIRSQKDNQITIV